MLGQKKDDYLSSLNKARRRRRRGFDWKFAAVVAGAVVLLAGAAWGGCSLIRSWETGETVKQRGEATQAEAVAADPQAEAEEVKRQQEEAEKQAVADSYQNLGIVQVTGYLNLRESADTTADVIGKVPNEGACEIIDDSVEGWYQVTSGELTGYVSS